MTDDKDNVILYTDQDCSLNHMALDKSKETLGDMENVLVVGDSSFPHFGHHNPTGTLGALA